MYVRYQQQLIRSMMKWILAILLLISVTTFGQTDDTTKYISYPTQYGMKIPRMWAPTTMIMPSGDTTGKRPGKTGAFMTCTCDGNVYRWNGSNWVAFGGSSTTLNNVGTGFAWATTPNGSVKKFNPTYGLIADSSTSNTISLKVDTSSANHIVTQSDLNDAIPRIDSIGRVYSLQKLGIANDANITIGSTSFGTNQATQLQAVLNKAQHGPITILWDVHTSTDTTLYINSNTRIIFAPGCGIILRNNSDCNVFMNKNRTTGTIVDSNIVFTGENWIVNGNGANQVHDSPTNGWVSGIRMVGVRNVVIEGGSVLAAPTFQIWLMNAYNVKARNLVLDYAPGYNASFYATKDGIHINGPFRFGDFQNIVTRSFDDALAFNANDVWQSSNTAGTCTVCGGVSSYDPWAGYGAIEDVNVDGLTFADGCLFGLRFLSTISAIKRISVANLKGTTSLQLCIMDNWFEGEAANPGAGDIQDIAFNNVYAEVGTNTGGYTYKNAYFSMGCKMKNITIRNMARSLFTQATYPTFDITTPAYIEGLLIDGLQQRGETNDGVPWMQIAGYIDKLRLNNVSNVNPSRISNNPVVKIISSGLINTLQLNNINIDSISTIVDVRGGKINWLNGTNIIHQNSAYTFLYTEDSIQRVTLSNFTGGQKLQVSVPGLVKDSAGDAFAVSVPPNTDNLNDVTTRGATTANSITVGGLTIPHSGTNRNNQFTNNSASDNFATLDLRPASGTDVASSLRIIPRGNGYIGAIRGDMQIFNTDYVADATNWELFLLRANATEFMLASLANGTGTLRPIKISTGSNTGQLDVLTNGNISMSGSLAVTGNATVADQAYDATTVDRKSTRLNSSHRT